MPMIRAWRITSMTVCPPAVQAPPVRPRWSSGRADATALADEQRSQDEGDRGQELDQDVQRGAGGVLERVTHGVADDGRGVGLGALAQHVALVVLEQTRL